jgi:hypothetical protein
VDTSTIINPSTSTDLVPEEQHSSSEAETVEVEKLPSVCPAGTSLQILDSAKSLCLHVKGASAADGSFAVSSTVRMPIVTMPCATKGTSTFGNQVFVYDDAAGTLKHNASGLLVALQSTPLRDGTPLTVVAPAAAGAAQSSSSLWKWFSPYTGGLITSSVDNTFSITDSLVNSGVDVGLPVHMWRLKKSLPNGAPNANWIVSCQ